MALLKFQMAPKPKLLISSGSKKESRYICLSEAKASHSHKMWAEVSSLTPHFLHKGLSSSPSRWRCLLRVLWPVSRPVTALDWILLKVKNFALVPRLGPLDKLPSLSLGISKAREMRNYCTPHIIKENLFSIHRCNYTPRQSFRIALYMFCRCVVQQLRPLNTLLIFLKASKQRYLLLEWTFYVDGKQMGGKIYDRPSSSILCFLNGHDYTHVG
jgi:hypothetical protein